MVLVVDFGFDDDESADAGLSAMDMDGGGGDDDGVASSTSSGAYMSLFEHLPNPMANMQRMRESRPSVWQTEADDDGTDGGRGNGGVFSSFGESGGSLDGHESPRNPPRPAPVTVDELADLLGTRLNFSTAAEATTIDDNDGGGGSGGGGGAATPAGGDDAWANQQPLPARPVPPPQPTLGRGRGIGGPGWMDMDTGGVEGAGGSRAAGMQGGGVKVEPFGIGSKRGTRMGMGMSMGPRGTLKTHLEPVVVRGDSQSRSKALRELDGALWDCDKQRQDIAVIVAIGMGKGASGRGSSSGIGREHGGTAILLGAKGGGSQNAGSESSTHMKMPTPVTKPTARRIRELTYEPFNGFDFDDGFDGFGNSYV